MKKLSTYLKQLDFEYAISYSGLRGKAFELLYEEHTEQIKKLEKELEGARYMEQSKLNKKIKLLESEIDTANARIINQAGALHQSTKQIHTFQKDDKAIKSIFEILHTKFEEQHYWMCAPIFRDAIVFYSKEGNICGILHICFSCDWMINEKEEDLEIDHSIFPRLKEELIKLGHTIER